MKKNKVELRDYFAAHCPKKFRPTVNYGILIKFFDLPNRIEEVTDDHWLKYEVIQRYKYADEMIKIRKTLI